MASSDEDDIDALRNAALASMKNKLEAQEPQGIQVLSLGPSQTYKEPGEEEFHSEFHQIPLELQHALSGGHNVPFGLNPIPYNNGPPSFDHGRGRGFMDHRGRGRGFDNGWGRGGFVRGHFQRGYQQRGRGGRGRGFNNRFPGPGLQGGPRFGGPPPNQSALIVIQVEGSQEKQELPPQIVKPSATRTLLLRPQDKWASPEGVAPTASPPRPKDTSKFRRYDEDTDSDEEDELMDEDEDESVDQRHAVSGMPPDIDEEPPDNDAEWDDSEVEVHKQDIYSDEEVVGSGDTKRIVVDTHQVSLGMQDSVSDEVGESQPALQSSGSDLRIVNRVVLEPDDSTKITEHENVEMFSAENETLPGKVDGEYSNDVDCDLLNNDRNSEVHTSLDPGEVGQDDSVSNSNYKFSRFERRNRRGSESVEESDVESDNEDEGNNEAGKSLSDISLDDDILNEEEEDEEAEEANHSINEEMHLEEVKENETLEEDINKDKQVLASNVEEKESNLQQTEEVKKAKIVKELPKTIAATSKPSAATPSSSSSSSSGSSSSDSDSSDSESSSSSSASRQSSPDTSKIIKPASTKSRENKVLSKQRTLPSSQKSAASNEFRQSKSPSGRIRSDSDRHHKHSQDYSGKGDRYKQDQTFSERSKSRMQSHESIPSKSFHRKMSPKHRRIEAEEIKADPEFDAANYRDESMYKSNRERRGNVNNSASRREIDRFENTKENRNVPKQTQEKFEKEKEPRHFKEISRLKDEHSKLGMKGSARTINTDDSKNRRDAKHKTREENYKSRDSDRSIDIKTSGRDIVRDNRKHNSVASESKSPDSRNGDKDKYDIKKTERDYRDKARRDKQDIHKDRDVTHEKGSKKLDKASTQPFHDPKQAKNKHRKDQSQSKINEPSKTSSSKKRPDSLKEKAMKRRSIEERLKKIADLNESSDSDSDKSVSSLSDVSSDSETESWRNKKTGASRKTDDIERERRRRKLLERETQRREREMRSECSRKDSARTDRDRNDRSHRKDAHRDKNEKQNVRRHTDLDKASSRQMANSREKYYHKKNMVFVDEEASAKKATFEETDSESDAEGRLKGGVISVVKTSNTGKETGIPKLMDIQVSRPVSVETGRKSDVYSRDSLKKERLVIQVQESSGEEKQSGKSRKDKKKSKHKKETKKRAIDTDESEEERGKHREQVVKVVFNDEAAGQKSKRSVYERLGLPGTKKEGKLDQEVNTGVKRSKGPGLSSGSKRLKVGDGKKHQKKSQQEEPEDQDAELNRRIRKIQEKNEAIMRRKQEVEQDKERYG